MDVGCDPRRGLHADRNGTPVRIGSEDALADGTGCAVIVTDHDGVDYAEVARRAPVVVDTRNALAGVEGEHIFRQ